VSQALPRLTGTRVLASPVAVAWLGSRLTVLAALLVAHAVHFAERGSLVAWDAAWYEQIATLGYQSSPDGAVRFFPLWPLLGRLASLTGVPAGAALVVLGNVAALAYLVLARRVAVAEQLGAGAAQRVPAVVAFAPAGAVLVMGYTEALFGVLLCAVLLSARRGRWWVCATAALAAGALRPTGVVVALPIAIEAWRRWGEPGAGRSTRTWSVAAVVAPVLGMSAFLLWCATAYGDPLAPFTAQLAPALRGGVFVNPLTTLGDIPRLLATREIVGMAANLLFIGVAVFLIGVCVKRLPASFTAFAVATVLLALTAWDFRSFERYASTALPLLLAAAVVLTDRPRLRRWVTVLAPVVLFGQAVLIFGGWYLP
jgi:hypothetical protein